MNSVWTFILIVNGLLIFKIVWDGRAKGDGRTINHWQSAIIDTLLYSASAYLLFKPDWFSIVGYLFAAWSWRWLLFDPIFGKIHWDDWHYHGTSDWLDRLLIRIGPWHPLVKLIPVAIGTTLLIL